MRVHQRRMYALDSGGALRAPFQQFRPDFRAATRPMSSHGRHVTKAFHSNSVSKCVVLQICIANFEYSPSTDITHVSRHRSESVRPV